MTVDEAIVSKVLPQLYQLIDQLLEANGHDKKLVVEARRLLPAGYKHSFAKEKL